MEQAVIRVRGMVCRQCENTIAFGLARLHGVVSVDACYDTASVSVSYDTNRCTRDEIDTALARLGYPAGEGITGPGVRTALAYNGGRVLSYALVGAVFGAVGSVIVYTAGIRSAFFVVAGALVVAMGLRMMGFAVPMPTLRIKAKYRPRRRTSHRPLVVGLLTGIMPCGALASMWMVAAASGSALAGGAAMLVFALGTVPLMLVFSVAGHLLPASWSRHLLRASAILVVALGLSLAWKGLALLPGLL